MWIQRWVSEHCEFDEHYVVPLADLRAAIWAWMRAHGLEDQLAVNGPRQVVRRLIETLPERRLYTEARGNRRSIVGLRLKHK